VKFDQVCTGNGIRHLLTAPCSPTTTGKIERLHKTMRAEFFTPKDRLFATIGSCRTRWMRGWRSTTPRGRTSPAAAARPSRGARLHKPDGDSLNDHQWKIEDQVPGQVTWKMKSARESTSLTTTARNCVT
jgi:hypothetical protein